LALSTNHTLTRTHSTIALNLPLCVTLSRLCKVWPSLDRVSVCVHTIVVVEGWSTG
jgi:hypothetical protein